MGKTSRCELKTGKHLSSTRLELHAVDEKKILLFYLLGTCRTTMSASSKPWIWVTSDIWKHCKYNPDYFIFDLVDLLACLLKEARQAEIGDYELLKCISMKNPKLSRGHKLCKHRNKSKCPDGLYFCRADVSKIPLISLHPLLAQCLKITKLYI